MISTVYCGKIAPGKRGREHKARTLYRLMHLFSRWHSTDTPIHRQVCGASLHWWNSRGSVTVNNRVNQACITWMNCGGNIWDEHSMRLTASFCPFQYNHCPQLVHHSFFTNLPFSYQTSSTFHKNTLLALGGAILAKTYSSQHFCILHYNLFSSQLLYAFHWNCLDK